MKLSAVVILLIACYLMRDFQLMYCCLILFLTLLSCSFGIIAAFLLKVYTSPKVNILNKFIILTINENFVFIF